jgi:hypothetical protein
MADFIDQHSAEGKALQQTVKVKLRSYLGEDYNDEVGYDTRPSLIAYSPATS